MLYLVRHGQSTWNRDRRVQGQRVHPALTELGRAQVAAARTLISAELRETATVVSSDLLRARQSAHILASGRAVVLDRRLREQHAGRLQGLSTDDAMTRLDGHDWNDPDLRLGGGESPRQVTVRMAGLLREYRGRTAVLVSHGDTIRAALGWWCGHEPARAPWVTVESAAVFALEVPGTFRALTGGTTPPG